MARFGSIGTQYFNDAGDPLSGGKLQFFESGTTTPKTTYSDVEQTIPNTNPVVLDAAGRQPNIFFSGSAKCILYDSSDVQIQMRDPVGDEASRVAFSSYSPLITYSINDLTIGPDGLYYRSLQNANINKTPADSPLWWELFTLVPVDDAGAEVLEAIGSVRLTAANRYYYTTANNTFAAGTITAFGRSLVDDANAEAARNTLGLGDLAPLDSINNGNWSGTDLAIENGGTGASNAEDARENLGIAQSGDLSSSGYVQLIGGLIIQWGSASVSSGGTGTITYPIAFPNSAFRVVVSRLGDGNVVVGASNPGATTCSIYGQFYNGTTWLGADTTVAWVAFGY